MKKEHYVVKGEVLFSGKGVAETRYVSGKSEPTGREINKIAIKLSEKKLRDYDGLDNESTYTPKWVRGLSDDANFKSLYNIPVTNDGIDLDDIGKGSEVEIAFKVKEGCIYPLAVKVLNLVEKELINLNDLFES